MRATKKKVLIITNQLEQEVDGVIDFLRERDIIIKRWNLCQFPENEFYSVSQSSLLFPKVKSNEILEVGWLHQYGQFSQNAFQAFNLFSRERSLESLDTIL